MHRAMLNHLVFVIFLATSVVTQAFGQSAGAPTSSAPNPVIEGTRWVITLESAGTAVELPEALRHVLVLDRGSRAILRQMPELGFAPSKWTKSKADDKTVISATFTSPDEGTVAVTATIGGTAKAPTMSGTAKWTVEDSTTEFKLTGKPAAALEGTSWTLTITPRPLEGDEEADDPFEERLTFFDGKAWLSSDSLPELEPVAAAPKAAASGGHEVKVTLTDGADRIKIACKITGVQLTGKLEWSDEESKLLDAKLSGAPAER